MTPKQRMLNAYRGVFNDRPAVAPEFWYYYPAKVLGLDMIRFAREVPFHLALKRTFELFDCEGWGVTFPHVPNPEVQRRSTETWLSDRRVQVRWTTTTPLGELTGASIQDRDEPAWATEHPLKDLERDLPAWEFAHLGGDPAALDASGMVKAWNEVGESYLLEAWIGPTFFDFLAPSLAGGFEQGIYLFTDPDWESRLEALRARYVARVVGLTRALCERTPFEALCIGCTWSCNSLLGPALWRRWDKPVIRAVCEEAHRHGRLVHVHFHGKCLETVADFAEIGIDCVCPFEREPGGDIRGLEDFRTVASLLKGRTTMNGGVHTVEALIRGTPDDVRRQVRETLEAFRGNPRVIVGTGDQVGGETPEANLRAMIAAAKEAP